MTLALISSKDIGIFILIIHLLISLGTVCAVCLRAELELMSVEGVNYRINYLANFIFWTLLALPVLYLVLFHYEDFVQHQIEVAILEGDE